MRQPTEITGIQLSPWRAFEFGGRRHALIHLPSSTVLEVSERIFKAALSSSKNTNLSVSALPAKNNDDRNDSGMGGARISTRVHLPLQPEHLANKVQPTEISDFKDLNTANTNKDERDSAGSDLRKAPLNNREANSVENPIPRILDRHYAGQSREEVAHIQLSARVIEDNLVRSQQVIKNTINSDEEAIKFLEKTHLALGAGKSFQTEPIDIRAIALNVEESCNLRCTYCYAGDGNYGHDSRMHHDIAIQSIAQLSKGKQKFHIAFFGGEPLLNFPLIKSVVLWCENQKETHYSFGITTNATLLNSTHLSFFKDHKVSLKISYDGDKAQAIQRLTVDRNQNVATQVKRKIAKYYSELDSLGMSIRATYSKEGARYFKESIEGILNDFESDVSYSKVASFDSKQSISLNEVEAIGADLTSIIRKLISQKNYEKIMRITNIAASMKILHKGYVNRMTCGAGIGYISVSTKGEYFLCHRFTESEEEKVGDLRNGLNYDKLSEIQSYRAGQHAPCNTCWMQRYCRGGCFQENKVEHGNLFKPSEIFCRMQEIELSLALEAYLDMKLNSPDLVEKYL